MNRNMRATIHRSATTYGVQNSISDTLLVRLKFEPNVDRKIEEMQNGRGLGFMLAMNEEGLHKTGLLAG
jgi:hypothetical protein